MRGLRIAPALSSAALAGLAVLLVSGAASAQTGTTSPPPAALVAPRTPGGLSTGAVQGNQGRMNRTVGSIDHHLLKAEKDRPRLPHQAPSRSQTLPGGTASGQSPR